MQYEAVFWSMATVVGSALLGGACCGRLRSFRALLACVALLAAAVFAVVFIVARKVGLHDLAAMLAVASFMFTLVIAAAAALLVRRILLARLAV